MPSMSKISVVHSFATELSAMETTSNISNEMSQISVQSLQPSSSSKYATS